ncbi:MAG TPA: HAD-IA family hydrolase [Kofleriaceae bacterium]|nr:HAD-IA family hydrolase [Kofleriaceae bacterium]
MTEPQAASITELLDAYEGVLLDAFGVLIDGSGALPGATALLGELARREIPYAIVSNDASRAPETFAHRFAGFGLDVPADRFVTSGTLLPDYFRKRPGARTCVLGTDDSVAFVRAGGAVPVALEPGMTIDAVAVCDDDGTPFVEGIELALSAIVRAVEAGRRPDLVCPNPDLIYPKGGGELGVTTGAMASLIELALARRLPHERLVFERLGKPEPHLFVAAAHRLGIARERLVMIGDQLETDIAGARAAGVPCALVAGISRWNPAATSLVPARPTYVLASIDPGSGDSGATVRP